MATHPAKIRLQRSPGHSPGLDTPESPHPCPETVSLSAVPNKDSTQTNEFLLECCPELRFHDTTVLASCFFGAKALIFSSVPPRQWRKHGPAILFSVAGWNFMVRDCACVFSRSPRLCRPGPSGAVEVPESDSE